MKHKTIKKSIIIIMVTTLLLSCVSSLAATQAIGDVTIATSNLILTPDDVINIYPDATNNQLYIAHYKFQFLPIAYTSSGGYLNGSFLWVCNVSFTLPSSYTLKSIIFSNENIVSDSVVSVLNNNGNSNSTSFRIYNAFSNYYVPSSGGKRVPICCPYVDLYVAVPTNSLISDISISYTSGDASGTVALTSYPEVNKGIAGVIGMSVLQALNTGDFNSDIEALLTFAAAQEDLLDDILTELLEANVNLSDIVYYLNNIQNTRLQTIISKIQELIDMGKQDTQAQNDLNAAASQMEGAAAAMNVTKPNMNAVIPQTLADADAVAAQGTIFSWLNNSYIIAILSAMMTIALIGFVLYGKSG